MESKSLFAVKILNSFFGFEEVNYLNLILSGLNLSGLLNVFNFLPYHSHFTLKYVTQFGKTDGELHGETNWFY